MSLVKLPSYTTPDGIAQYPRLITPDTKFVAEGVYSVKMEFTGEDAKTLSDFLDTKMEESYREAKKENPHKVIKKADSPYSCNDDGTLSVNFKMKAGGTTKDGKKWTRKPALLNADLTPYVGTDPIGGGSKLAISYTPSPFYSGLIGSGLSMRLESVQILELVTITQDPVSHGFVKREIVEPRVLPQAAVDSHADF